MRMGKISDCRLLLVDNFDSFTYNIYDYLSRIGADVKVKTLEEVKSEDWEEADGIVISPGPGNPVELPRLRNLVSEFLRKDKPLLGICLGHQVLALHFGARIEKFTPMHGKVSLVQKLHDSPLLAGIPDDFRVVRYHSLVVNNLPDCLIALVAAQDGCLMAFEHATMPVMGIQFHPEAHLSEFGLKLLQNWLDVCVKNQGAFFSPHT